MVAPTGRLASYDLEGTLLWQRRIPVELNLYGCWDLAADGKAKLLAGSSGPSGGQLYVFDAVKGDLLWTSPSNPGGVGTVKVVSLGESRARHLLWLPAASSVLKAYSFSPNAKRPELLWASQIRDFVSDPYSFSSITLTGSSPADRRIVITGARHAIPLIVLDAASGREVARRAYPESQGLESGGRGQLAQLKDLDGTGIERAIAVADYSSSSRYMFQGVSVTDPRNPADMKMLDTSPVGLHYAQGSVADFDGDGKDEILVSRYSPGEGRHDLLLLDAMKLTTKASLENFYLLAVVDLADGRKPLILGRTGVASESPSEREPLAACRWEGSGFHATAWKPEAATLATPLSRSFDRATVDNAGASAVVLKAAAEHPASILLLRSATGTRNSDQLVATDAQTGAVRAEYSGPAGVDLTLLAVDQEGEAANTRIILASNDGELVFLDRSLHPVARVPVGGYSRSRSLNGHSYEVAVVADLTGSGKNQIVTVDSRDRVLEVAAPNSRSGAPSSRVIADFGEAQELVAVPWFEGGSRLLVRRDCDGRSSLSLLDAAGSQVWERMLAPDEGPPVGLNFGRFHDSPQPDVAAACGSKSHMPRSTCAFDGRTGAPLWRSSVGTYWDGTLAVWDFDSDSFDDLALNFNAEKAHVLRGQSGQVLALPAGLPPYGKLGSVDYNGAPIVVGSAGNGTEILNAEDDAHLALLSVARNPSGAETPSKAAVKWAVPQSHFDDQRYSMPAVAPDGSGGWLLGVGSQQGSIEARRGSNGSLLWRKQLRDGRIVRGNRARTNFLSSVVAVDVNGDGKTEFLVGGFDGWLYALDCRTGSLLWSLDLGSPLGEPIAADIDNDGSSEVLVPAADGYLYAVGPRPK